MSKLLYLLRHAQSVEKQAEQADRDRELTPIGTKETFQMGAFLHREKILPEVIYCSNAVRASTTAQLISDTIKLEVEKIIIEEELFQASARTLFEFIRRLDDSYSNVMCICHNPAISYLAEYLTNAEIGEMPTAGMVTIRLNVDSWEELEKGSGEMTQYVYPEMFNTD
jgi:phosphohistidine phosphatase